VLANPLVFVASTFFLLPGIAIAIPLHELGHGLVAYWLGDKSPRYRGFFSPSSPEKFFTLYGLLMMVFWRVGWGARIPVNEQRLVGLPKKLAYHLAGPAANLLGAAVTGFAFRPLGFIFNPFALPQPSALAYVAYVVYGIYFANLSVMAFNLLPVPGFDGWRIIEELFRRRNPRFFFDVAGRQQQIQFYLLIGLFLTQLIPAVGGSLLGLALTPFYEPAATVILGGCSGYYGLVPCLR